MVVHLWLGLLYRVQFGSEEFELLEELLLVQQVRPCVVDEGRDDVLVRVAGVGTEGGLEVLGDGDEALGEEGFLPFGLEEVGEGSGRERMEAGRGGTHIIKLFEGFIDAICLDGRAALHALNCSPLRDHRLGGVPVLV